MVVLRKARSSGSSDSPKTATLNFPLVSCEHQQHARHEVAMHRPRSRADVSTRRARLGAGLHEAGP